MRKRWVDVLLQFLSVINSVSLGWNGGMIYVFGAEPVLLSMFLVNGLGLMVLTVVWWNRLVNGKM